jgi:streptomycin 6-kinase
MRDDEQSALTRFADRARAWRVTVERSFETESSLIALGKTAERPVVLKVVKRRDDEWNSGNILQAFDGQGMVRVYNSIEGAMLLERLEPATPLTTVAFKGRDEEATDILADVILRMKPADPPPATPTVTDLAGGFAWYRETGDEQIPRRLLDNAERIYRDLAASQEDTRLLHADLQHYNILLDAKRGWLAIDPKGVVGEVEYEIGASLRNPYERPELLTSPRVIERRIRQYESALNLDGARILGWGFAQAVLSAIWSVEDGHSIPPASAAIVLAQSISSMLAL